MPFCKPHPLCEQVAGFLNKHFPDTIIEIIIHHSTVIEILVNHVPEILIDKPRLYCLGNKQATAIA